MVFLLGQQKGNDMNQTLLFRTLANLLADYESQLSKMDRRWPSLPEGFLRFRKVKGLPYFFRVCQHEGVRTEVPIAGGTTQGMRLMQSLMEKHIILHSKPILRKNIKAMKALLAKLSVYDPEGMIEKWRNDDGPAANDLILPDCVFLPGQLNVGKWIADTRARRYRTNPAYPENLKHPTKQGYKVRSKSEASWDDALFEANAIFRYESILVLKSGKVVYPDFIVLHPKERRLMIIEHFGRMDDPDYAMKSMRKLKEYTESGFIPGRDLFFTMETREKPLTIVQIKAVMREAGL